MLKNIIEMRRKFHFFFISMSTLTQYLHRIFLFDWSLTRKRSTNKKKLGKNLFKTNRDYLYLYLLIP